MIDINNEKKLNILYVAQFAPPHIGGGSITTYEIATGLAKKDHKIFLLVSTGYFLLSENEQVPKKETVLGVAIYRVGTFIPHYVIHKHPNLRIFPFTLGYLPLIFLALKISKEKRIDAIIAQYDTFYFSGLAAYIISRILKVPLIIRSDDVMPGPYLSGWDDLVLNKIIYAILHLFSSYALKKADVVTVVSNDLKKIVKGVYSLNNVFVHPNGVNIDKFNPLNNEKVKEELNIKDQKIIFFSGVSGRRGVDLLIKAIPFINTFLKNRILIAGCDESKKEKLSRLSKSLKVEENMMILPLYKSPSVIRKFVSVADVTIGPLKKDLFTIGAIPLKVLDYMALGKPVIALEGTVSKDLLVEGQNGIFLHHRDEKELAKIIVNLIENKDLKEKIGRNARTYVEKKFNWNQLIDSLEKIIYKTIKSKLRA